MNIENVCVEVYGTITLIWKEAFSMGHFPPYKKAGINNHTKSIQNETTNCHNWSYIYVALYLTQDKYLILSDWIVQLILEWDDLIR